MKYTVRVGNVAIPIPDTEDAIRIENVQVEMEATAPEMIETAQAEAVLIPQMIRDIARALKDAVEDLAAAKAKIDAANL
jgi:hypothetical protein